MRGDDTGARICVTNAKGGTGKTTVAINVAGALNERGRDVLFVDLDPQGNATEGLGLVEAYDAAPPTLFDALTDHTRRDVVNDLIVEHDEMDVLPASIDLLQAEHELTIADLIARIKSDPNLSGGLEALESLAINVESAGITEGHALDALDVVLSEIDHDYDYIIVDSPPFYGKLTDTGIFATRNVLVPALTEATSERAIELLIDQIAALESQVGIEVNTVGVVANRIENTSEDRTMLQWLEEVFADFPVWEVRKRVALQRAFSAGSSIFGYEERVDMEEVFLDVATELDRQFGYAEVTA
ncbi:ParA family protein [Salinibaculum rarum]|uniref:ParA family protein n=1 Tax=Salinibaculum rarum TaxID=3058903 RepID=UPI00265DD188|nr:ParA family protein [Salinibaculum sp. KK48]